MKRRRTLGGRQEDDNVLQYVFFEHILEDVFEAYLEAYLEAYVSCGTMGA